ncbi:MAG: hypothetical protein ACRDU9_03910 [Acidimicrobiia bacterium]
MIGHEHGDEEIPFDDWEADESPETVPPPAWRRPLLVGVAALTATAMALVPLYNLIGGRSVADNGLEVCGFDYCVVQEAVREARLDLTMSRLANTFLDDTEAGDLADELTDHLGVGPVEVEVVDDLVGRLGGVYDPETRKISIERPARAWTVLHEVAHVVESGHGADFHRLVIDLATWIEGENG